MDESQLPADPTGSLDPNFDVDAALSRIENDKGGDRPMTARDGLSSNNQDQALKTGEQAKPGEEGKTEAQAIQELMFKHGDKEIRLPFTDPKVTQWASQGYDYAQKMQAFNQERQQIEQKAYQLQQVENALANQPELYNNIREALINAKNGNPNSVQAAQTKVDMQQAIQGLDPAHPLVQYLSGVNQKLSSLETHQQNWIQEKQLEANRREDEQLTSEIKSIREKYKDLDWSSQNDRGLDLEKQALILAQEKRLGFTDAFNLLTLEDREKRNYERGKTEAQAELEKNKKLGLLGKTQAPTKGVSTLQNIKSKSWGGVLNEALMEARSLSRN